MSVVIKLYIYIVLGFELQWSKNVLNMLLVKKMYVLKKQKNMYIYNQFTIDKL